jgi:hypothetical protein
MEDKLLKITGEKYDKAIVGIASVWQGNQRVETLIYSGQKLMEIFMDEGMTDEEAIEWISFNIEGAYVGLSTPIIMWEYDENSTNLI